MQVSGVTKKEHGEAHIARRVVARKGKNDSGRFGRTQGRKRRNGQREGTKKNKEGKPKEKEKEKTLHGLKLVEVVQGKNQAARGREKEEMTGKKKTGWNMREIGEMVVPHVGISATPWSG